MWFLNARAFWLLALLPVVLLLHFLRRPRRKLQVSNLHLWRDSEDRDSATRKWRRVPPSLFLVLEVLTVLCLIGALARPVITAMGYAGEELILVFDASASMAAREGSETRFEMAQREAIKRSERVAGVRLLLATNRPELVSDRLTERSELRRRIRALEPTDTVANLEEAVLLALESLESEGRVVVLSDGAGNANIPDELRGESVEYVQVGSSTDNQAISKLSVRRSRVSPFDHDLLVEVVNYSPERRHASLTLQAGDRDLLREEMDLEPQGRRTFGIDGVNLEGAVVEARLDVDDDLEVDNRASAPTRRLTARPVLLVTEGNLFLESVLTVDPLIELTVVNPRDYRTARYHNGFDLVVLDGIEPGDSESGRFLVFRHPETAASVASPPLGPTRLSSGQVHPAMSWIDLSTITVGAWVPIVASRGEFPLVEIDNGVVISAIDSGPSRRITVAFDVRDSTWPFSVSFPVFMSNAVHWLGQPEDTNRLQIRPGEMLEWRLPPSWNSLPVSIHSASGRRVPSRVAEGRLIVGSIESAGLYSIQAGEHRVELGVNLFSDDESNIHPAHMDRASGKRGGSGGPASLQPGDLEISRLLVYLAIALLAFEGGLFWRRLSG